MTSFHLRCFEIANRETKGLTVLASETRLPRGSYLFTELYCDEPDCDCRRVLIQVTPVDRHDKVLATINFGWETEAFYLRWCRDPEMAHESTLATLDFMNRQSRYAETFLEAFREVIKDRTYVARLKQHYKLFKATLRKG